VKRFFRRLSLRIDRLLQRITNHPFRLLLYLEWLLLSIVIFVDIPWDEILPSVKPLVGSSFEPSIPNYWLLTLILIIIFGLMGLRLPTGSKRKKWFYTVSQFVIILLAVIFTGWSDFTTPYVIILIRSCLIFPRKEQLIVGILSLICFIISIDTQSLKEGFLSSGNLSLQQINTSIIFIILSSTLNVAIIFIFVLALVDAFIKERQSRQQLKIAHNQLRIYSLKIQDQVVLEERNRIAREIHDSVGHALTAQTIQLESALLFCHSDANKTQKYIEVSRELAIDALNEIRKSISTLRAELLQGKSLVETINLLIENFYKITNIRANLSVNLRQSLDTDVNIAIYRIVQEALTNISKHSNATTVDIILEKQIESIRLRVEDNGQGFNTEQNTTGFGLQGINERVRALGGRFLINSTLGTGCKIIVDIPLPKYDFSEE